MAAASRAHAQLAIYEFSRTDADAPARRPQVGTYTPVSRATARTSRRRFRRFARSAPPTNWSGGSRMRSPVRRRSHQAWQDFRDRHATTRAAQIADRGRAFRRDAAVSVATRRAASPRPPELMVLNEPEASLHPDLWAARAARRQAATNRRSSSSPTRRQLVSELATVGRPAHPARKAVRRDDGRRRRRPKWVWPARVERPRAGKHVRPRLDRAAPS